MYRPPVLAVVDELAGDEPASSLPAIVSVAASALGMDQACVHLLVGPEPKALRCYAAVGLPEVFRSAQQSLPPGAAGGIVGRAAETGAVVVEEDGVAPAAGIRSGWAVPIVGTHGVVGVVSGYSATPGRPPAALLELVFLYAGYTAVAIERERLVAEAVALRQAQTREREFLSRVSHELRTPLTAIRGYASSLRQRDVTWDPSSQDRFLAAIDAESARLSRLVADLLDFSAIDSGVLRLQRDWCEIPLVLKAAHSCLPAGPAAAVDLLWPGGLPPVWGDHDRLEQVFLNLMENALRHTGPGTRVRVTAGAGRRAGMVTVRVADDGPGIGPEEAARIFLPWERGRTDGPGAGLGLSIVRGIVDAHGGRVILEAAPAGASFAVELPVDPPTSR